MSMSSLSCFLNKLTVRVDSSRSATFTALMAAQLIAVLLLATSCQSVYYQTMEKFGYQKREILVDRVQEARDVQEEAKEQFQSALEEFSAVVNFSGGELESKYETLNDEFKHCESKANEVRNRIASVENVAEALFNEWESELQQYTNPNLRRASQRKLTQTRQHYTQLITAMQRAEAKMDPVLAAFRDQVLYLKHNLNAQAIASLHDELVSVEADIESLIKEMEASIAEADAFIQTMEEA